MKEVKRQAKVGEYIKIVNAVTCREQNYKNGDVFKAAKANPRLAGSVSVEGQPGFIYDNEYVVIKGYKE
jgi:hypothetical protein